MRLSVNIDHVATLRQARRIDFPQPCAAAAMVAGAGAHGVTMHLRLDRRHIQESDIAQVAATVSLPINIEMAAAPEMEPIVRAYHPHTVTLVPEDPREVTTTGGLDVLKAAASIQRFAPVVAAVRGRLSVFVDPDPVQVEALARLGVKVLELNTARYTEAFGGPDQDSELARVEQAARMAERMGFIVAAGHGLSAFSVVPIAAIKPIEELNIGHWIVGRAVFVGLRTAIGEILEACARGRSCPST